MAGISKLKRSSRANLKKANKANRRKNKALRLGIIFSGQEEVEVKVEVDDDDGRGGDNVEQNEEDDVRVKVEVMEEEEEDCSSSYNCLFCFEKITKNGSSLNKSDDAAEANYSAMFILKKMLSVPNDKLSEFLQKCGNPSEWIKFCGGCERLLNDALLIQKEINRLEVRLRKCQEGMISKIQTTWEEMEEVMSGESSTGEICPVNETRTFVAKMRKSSGCPLSVQGAGARRSSLDKPLKLKGDETEGVKASSNTEEEDVRTVQNLSPENDVDVPEDGAFEHEELHCGDDELPLEDDGPLPATTDAKYCESQVVTEKYDWRQNRPKYGGKYGCYLCPDLEEMSLDNLVHHIMFHNRRPLKCTKCNLYFSSQAELESNPFIQQESHSSTGITLCSSHNFVTVKYEAGNTAMWGCDHCPKKFTTETERDHHEKACELSPEDPKKVLKHTCSWCSKSYRNWAEWQLHRALEHPDLAPFCCHYCDQLFKFPTKEAIDIHDPAKLKIHGQTDHKSDGQTLSGVRQSPHVCILCGQVIWSCPELNEHMEMDHGLSKYDSYHCPICHVRKSKRTDVQGHINRVHRLFTEESDNPANKKIICEICGVKYYYSNSLMLEEHKFLEHGVHPVGRRILNCSKEECSFHCLQNKTMEQHMMRNHGEERKLKCRYCGKGFLTNSNLRGHEMIHKNAELKPYQCEICGNSFAVRNYLYIHMRLSHQNRPFASTNKKKPATRKRKSISGRSTSSNETISYEVKAVSNFELETALGEGTAQMRDSSESQSVNEQQLGTNFVFQPFAD